MGLRRSVLGQLSRLGAEVLPATAVRRHAARGFAGRRSCCWGNSIHDFVQAEEELD